MFDVLDLSFCFGVLDLSVCLEFSHLSDLSHPTCISFRRFSLGVVGT